MKRFRKIILLVTLAYLGLAGILWWQGSKIQQASDYAYKVEIHDVMRELSRGKSIEEVTAKSYEKIVEIRYQDLNVDWEVKEQEAFYASANGLHTSIRPNVRDGELVGYVRFDYMTDTKDNSLIWLLEGVLLFAFLGVVITLIYIQKVILQPFHSMSELPYELSKGHLNMEMQENKHRFFGRFMWGLSMLGDTLKDSRAKELKLLKEKKLLLLSLSHDIKIPLSAIKLHAKAMRENLYETEEKRQEAAELIENHVVEIEEYVKQIMTASSEEIINIEVKKSEFYLKDYIEKIQAVYGPKLAVSMVDFSVEAYSNKILLGDFERAFEVMENLLENAMKYGDGKRIKISFYEEEDCQVIEVFNSGDAVAVDQLVHLFDSFYRGSNVTTQQGNGLGLYIAKQIMNKMEGEIFAQRHENGMSFHLVFRM